MRDGRGAAPAGTRRAVLRRDQGPRARARLARPRAGARARASRWASPSADASLREAYQALGRVGRASTSSSIPQFQDQTVTLDLRDVPFEQALDGARHRRAAPSTAWLDSRVVNVIPDTPTKRREYEQQVVKTFFLSNADLKETIDLLRVVLGRAAGGARCPAPTPSPSTTRPTRSRPPSASSTIVDKQRAEVVVEVEILEVNRNEAQGIRHRDHLGARRQRHRRRDLPAGPSRSVRDAGNPSRDAPVTLDDNPYSRSNLVVTSLPGVIYRLLRPTPRRACWPTRSCAPREGQTAQARFGDQVPVPVTTFTPIATGGVAQQPITSFEYKNVGVNIDITPRVHHDGEVTLSLKLDISPVGAAASRACPTFNSRTVTSQIRLRDGETNILAGLISDTERAQLHRPPRPRQPAVPRPAVRAQPRRGDRDRHRDDADAAHRPAHDADRGGPALVPGRRRDLAAPLRGPRHPVLPGAPPRLAEPPRVEPIRPPQPSPHAVAEPDLK